MQEDYLKIVKNQETHLSDYARRSNDCTGRKILLAPDIHMTEYEKDRHLILYSSSFQQLKNKTHFFYNPKNIQICTLMEHALHVAFISSTICNYLSLNGALAEAIALAHDLGRPPFGHMGEDALRKIHTKFNLPPFMHEAHSLWTIDHFKDKDHNCALNLTYEVRDGVVCHYGEPNEQTLQPDRIKDIMTVEQSDARIKYPGTLEGCVVRLSDRLAYVCRDYKDAKEAGIITRDLPGEIKEYLGENIIKIEGTLIQDIVEESQGLDRIQFSNKTFTAFTEFKEFNHQTIYQNEKIERQRTRIDNILNELFRLFLEVTQMTKRGKERKNLYGDSYTVFFEFLRYMQYPDDESDAQIVSDFIAGMSDDYAIKASLSCFP